MKNILKDINTYSKNFKQHWLEYIALFIGIDIFTQVLVIPVFRYVTTGILKAGAIPFISYQNIIIIITTHTLVFLCLILELAILLLVIYGGFALILLGIREISQEKFTFRFLLKELIQTYKSVQISSVLLLALYFLLIVPFADIVYRTPLLAKIQIPEFILDFLMRNVWLASGLIIFYILAFIFGIRLILTLPIMIYQRKKTLVAMKESWKLTSHKQWLTILSRLVVLGISAGLILFVFYLLVYSCQLGLDHLSKALSFGFATFNLILVQAISEFVAIGISVISILIVIKPLDDFIVQTQVTSEKRKSIKIMDLCLITIFLLAAGVNNILYLKGTEMQRPITISHRGVSDKNGVQNTIPALKKTAELHPDYVEIDLHETKDKQFVVMHDENLKKLAGIDKAPKDLTLNQLTKITLNEDGHHAKIASFDQYLKAAAKLKQKLLIEVKTTPNDSPKMLERFNKKYSKLILKRNYQVQSLDYRVIEGLHQINPKLFVLYIQPYNFTYPQSLADGYSMEYSTLNNDFIWQAQLQNKPVYAWTVNESNIMMKMMYENVNGIITDRLVELNNTIKDFEDKRSNANKLLNYILI
ncbi:glycerophosphoryl diester phosphodiesterase membrane domain-containing protein [Lactobacillus taiwanensis]|uniref:glycerophosphoryl diester phosphodiesterase membrane domain-containing protein n=1 Tax=Lactobacillus taiwanensis TaxID=508451 RepID=UPI000B97F74D|nr:glycerophosphodiester phosphodiesterase [Lactobacillus taiwanensis]OYR94724.1 glycerophosphodiester phosphodiesterase [Lactobacillus taiwanensis]OYR99778.1 glycerophosphodiester phosphodiesterase [Lactobacillus taiwanensis]OYS12907.1 glycerophosphodiester phosphodiesterase [Lactobacillus taiwanensis]OYS30370.1 glycerophosphodiester phosphodiesterase [Lactobacillus taiwanensis]OYS31507.1 glycerophosphodiester phosphodiesterase [Lactobacillus taiwanensis]